MEIDFDPMKPLALVVHEQRAMEKYFEWESQALDDSTYRREGIQAFRKYVVRFIRMVSRKEKLEAFIPYLAVTYFDRYISKHPKPPIVIGSRPHRGHALALCCLSLAWKMRNKSFSFQEFFKDNSGLQISENHIVEAELDILNVLEWRLRAVTALCFVQYFFDLAPIPRFNLKHFSQIIIQSQGDIQFTIFKPSVIAASAILAANHFLYPNELKTLKRKFSAGQHVKLDKKKLTSCLNSLIGMCTSMGLIVKEEDAQRMAVEGLSSSRQAEGETETGAANEETPFIHAPGKKVMGSSEIQEVPMAEEKDLKLNFELKWKIDDFVKEDYFKALVAFDSDPEEPAAGIVAWLRKFCPCIR